MYDMSSFGKLRVEGRDAEAFLNYVCGGDMSVPAGKIVYTQFLNNTGGIEADVTVTRLSETAYLVVTPAATRLADETWLRRHVGDRNVVITDVTAGEAVLAVMGPQARDLMQRVSPGDFSNEVNPFGTAQEIELGMGLARVHRVTYVGELGWEIYVSSDMAGHAFETLYDAGQDLGLKLCGMHMMDSCRIEKGFRHFGHDITCEDHVLEAGLGFAVKTAKPDFIGRDAVLAKKESGLETRMLQFKLTDPEPLLYHNEPIIRDGEIVGYLSSGAYGHHLGAAMGLGYVPCKGETAADVLGSTYEIDVMGTRVKAEASLKPMYDPKIGTRESLSRATIEQQGARSRALFSFRPECRPATRRWSYLRPSVSAIRQSRRLHCPPLAMPWPTLQTHRQGPAPSCRSRQHRS